jgi:hypothetical protein
VTAKLEFFVTARRVDASGRVARCKDAALTLDTALKYGTVFNTVAPGTDLQGVLIRAT